MERVMVTLSEDLLGEVDAAASGLGRKRSHVVRQVLRNWLDQQRRQQFEALLAEGYQETAGEAGGIAAGALPLELAATEGVLHWDE